MSLPEPVSSLDIHPAAACAAYGAMNPPSRTLEWVPIRSLSERHRPRLLDHLLSLAPEDRYMRFGYAAADDQICRYIDHIDFDHDEVFGVFNRRLQLIAMAHLAYDAEPSLEGVGRGGAEFGVSVIERARGRRLGSRMFDHAVLRARNRGVDTLVIHALTENAPMLKIVRAAGAVIDRNGGDAEARLKLPPETTASRLRWLVEQQLGELDYHFKQGALHSGQ